MDAACHDHKLLVPDVIHWVRAGDRQDGDVIPGQGLTQGLHLDVLRPLLVRFEQIRLVGVAPLHLVVDGFSEVHLKFLFGAVFLQS